jgi:hypothetical protein
MKASSGFIKLTSFSEIFDTMLLDVFGFDLSRKVEEKKNLGVKYEIESIFDEGWKHSLINI